MELPPEQPSKVTTHEIGRRTYIVADVDPLDVDGVRTVAVGAGLWLLAFVLLLPFSGRLVENDRVWWLWTCLAGFGLGVIGWDYCRRRRKHRHDREADFTTATHGDAGGDAGVDGPADANRPSQPSGPI